MRVLTPVVPANVVAMAARICSRLDAIGAAIALGQSEQRGLPPSHCNYRALQRDAAEGTNAGSKRLVGTTEMKAVVKEKSPTVGGGYLCR